MKDKIKGLVIGITIGTMLTSATAFAANGLSIKAILHNINIYVDGTKKKTDVDVITYKGTTYVPARSIGESIGEKVGLQGNNLYIGKQPTVTQITETQAMFLVMEYFKKTEKVSFKVIYMVNDQDDNYYYVGAFEDFPDRVHPYKGYKVHKVTGKVTYIKPVY